MDERASYKSAGVDIDKANLFVEKSSPCKNNHPQGGIERVGGFGACSGWIRKNLRIRSWFLRRMAWGQS